MKKNAVTWEEKGAKGTALTGWRAYVLAAGFVGLALAARFALDPLWKDRLPFVPFFVAVFLVAQVTEMGPTVMATVAGFVLAEWFFILPRRGLPVSDPAAGINGVFYFALCGVVIFFTTRARRALARERAARMALAQMAAIIESSDDAIIGKSLDGTVVSWNAGAAKLYGYTEVEAVGRPVDFLMSPEAAKDLAPLLAGVTRGEPIRHFETTRRKKDGELVEVSLCISPVRNAAGQVVGASTIARDVTERKRAEREKEHLLKEEERLLGEVKTLNALLPICAYCKKIRDDHGDWNQLDQYIRERSSAGFFTHSVCPECAGHHFGEFVEAAKPVK